MSATSKILLLEDNPRIAGQLRALLEGMGLEVHVATTGIEALLMFNRELPRVVILEQFLPLLSGEDVLRRLRAHLTPAELPAVMLISSRFGTLTAEVREQLDVVLEKPLQAQRFQQGIQHALQKSVGQPRPLPGAHKPEQFYVGWGDLQQTPLPVLLFQLCEHQFTGILTLALEQGERRLAFRDGLLYYAESLVPDEQFLSFLQRRAADSQALSRLTEIAVGTGGRAVLQREALLRSGFLPALEMGPLYHLYLENVVIRSLFLGQGPYQLLDDLAYVARVSQGEPIALLPLLFEGVQHYYTPTRLLQGLAPYRDYACQLSDQYTKHISSLAQKFPSISFAPQRISSHMLSALLDHFSPHVPLNAQIVQTLLLSQLLSLQPLEELPVASGRPHATTEARGQQAAAKPTGHFVGGLPTKDASAFPSGAYRSSLPPISGALTEAAPPPGPAVAGPRSARPKTQEALPHLRPGGLQGGLGGGLPPGALVHPASPLHTNTQRTGQPDSPMARTGQHHGVTAPTGKHPGMQSGQHGNPITRTGQHGNSITRTGQHASQPGPFVRTGQHNPAHRSGQHGSPLVPSAQPMPRNQPLHQSGQQGSPLTRTGQSGNPMVRTGQHHGVTAPTGQHPGMQSGQHGNPITSTGQHGNPITRTGQHAAQRLPRHPGASAPGQSPDFVDALPLPPQPSASRSSQFPSAEPAFRRQLDEDYLRVQSDDYFRVLDLSIEASDDDIRAAYKRFFRLYNADRFKRDPNKEAAAKANEVYRRSSQACAVLSTPHARKAYEEQREQRQPEEQNALHFAREEFRQGEYFLQHKRFREAIPHFRRALEANEKDPAYYLRLGWSLFRSAPKDTSQALLARTYIERALQMNPVFEDAYFYLGYIRKEQGALDEAAVLFQRILLLNPGHADAHQLLAEISGK